MWRPARPEEDALIRGMCLDFYREDPGEPVSEDQVQCTLDRLREDPIRGRAIVLEQDGLVVGYALLISFWSNEYGGEICNIDELYVKAPYRNRGLATSLFSAVSDDRSLWPERPVLLELEVTPNNHRARALYERLGFRSKNLTFRRRLP